MNGRKVHLFFERKGLKIVKEHFVILSVFFSCFTQFGNSFHCLSFDEFRDTAPLNCGGH